MHSVSLSVSVGSFWRKIYKVWSRWNTVVPGGAHDRLCVGRPSGNSTKQQTNQSNLRSKQAWHPHCHVYEDFNLEQLYWGWTMIKFFRPAQPKERHQIPPPSSLLKRASLKMKRHHAPRKPTNLGLQIESLLLRRIRIPPVLQKTQKTTGLAYARFLASYGGTHRTLSKGMHRQDQLALQNNHILLG